MSARSTHLAEPICEASIGVPVDSAKARNLDGVFVRSIAWTGGMRWASQLLGWASTLILAHLLSPEDYGLVGMATVYFGLVAIVNEFGLGTAVVTLHKLKSHEVAQLNSIAILLGIMGAAASVLLSGPLAAFYHAPDLHRVVLVMSTSLVITSFKTIPYALLQKELRFKNIAVIEGIQAILQPTTTILLAWLGFRYWSIVAGGLAGLTFSTVAVLGLRPHGYARPHIRRLKETLKFSRHVLVGQLSWFAYTNADFIVAGRMLGQKTLGLYTFAWTLANVPIDKISALVCQVAPAFLAAIHEDLAELRRYLKKLTVGLALVTVPVALGFGLIADEFVILALGSKWDGVIRPLQVLALHASLRSVTPLFAIILTVRGKSRFMMYMSILMAIVMPLCFYIGSHWGAVGIAAVWLIGFPILSIPSYWRALSSIKQTVREYLKSILPIFKAAFAMAAVVLAVKSTIASYLSLSLCLAVEVLVGATVYLLIMFFFYREYIEDMRQVLHLMRNRA